MGPFASPPTIQTGPLAVTRQPADHPYSTDLGGGPQGGNSWNLEGWARDVSWDYAMHPLLVWTHLCNWYEPA